MPGGDRTGPLGAGPRTGRSAGYCAGYEVPGYMNPVFGAGVRGRGIGATYGRGAGRGRRNRYYATGMTGWQRAGYGYNAAGSYPYVPEYTIEEEKAMLKEEAAGLEQGLEDIRERTSTLEETQDRDKK